MGETGIQAGRAAIRALAALARAADAEQVDAAIAAAGPELANSLGLARVHVVWSAPPARVTVPAHAALLPIVVREDPHGALVCETNGDAGLDPEALDLLRAVAAGISGAASRVAAESGWRETEDRLQSLIQGTTDAVWCYESPEGIPVDQSLEAQLELVRDMVLVEANLAYARARGASGPHAMLGKRMREIAITPEAGIRHVYTLLVANGFKRVEAAVESPAPSGVRYLVIESFAVLRDRRLRRLWGSIRDDTERRQSETQKLALERQLHHAQKLESVGLLAGGIAHDFNNLLTVIGSATRFADVDLQAHPARARESLALVTEATTRAADLTRRLLAFSRHEPTRREVVDANQRAREVMRLLRRLVRETVDLELLCGEGVRLIDADPTQFEQALVNLCVNAADAIADVGRVEVRTANADIAEDHVRRHPGARPGSFVRVSVTDTGCGIEPETRERIFEPFFTTKPNAAGTGLGLSVVYGVARQHGGFVEVESEVGVGSTFHLYFPVSQSRSVTPPPFNRPTPVGGTETILVVEDDALVREVVERLLGNAGYALIVAGDGEQAVRLFEREGRRIDLVLLDAVLPSMSGRDVYEHLLALNPDVTVLFASGYTGGALPDEFLAERGLTLVPKPYHADDLLRAVREALDSRAAT